MMGRKKFVGALVVGAMGAAPAMADGFSERIVQQLEQQGFRGISTERTWLGRTRITAEGEDGQREIIVNPNTGEILRDLLLTSNAGGNGNGGLVNVSEQPQTGGGSGGGTVGSSGGSTVGSSGGGTMGATTSAPSERTGSGDKSDDDNGDRSRDRSADRDRDRNADRDRSSGGSGGSSGGSAGGSGGGNGGDSD